MEFADLVKKRQSDRRYEARRVEREKIEQCIATARLSPSACNSQPWRFIVVEDSVLRGEVAECAASMGMNKFTREAPVIIAVVLEKMNLSARIGSVIRDKEYSLLDIGIAVNQLCLQAADLGLGSCIVGWFDEKRVKRLLGIPRSKRVPLLITVGYSSDPLREKQRKPLEVMSGYDRY